MQVDWIANGRAHGSVANLLLHNEFNPYILRPWIGKDGRSYVMARSRQSGNIEPIVVNAPASLMRDEWKLLDTAVVEAAKPPLMLVQDVIGRGLTYNVPNGMGKTILEYQTHGDITGATTSMDGMRQSDEDRADFDISGLPLPIVHKDFSFSARQIAVSRNGSMPLDTTTAALAARKVGELLEDYALGVSTFAFGGYTVHGITSHPSRKTKTLTAPTDAGWTPQTLIGELLDMIQLGIADNQYGPYMAYFSPNWTQYLEDDYSAAMPTNTLRQRIAAIESIVGVRTIPRLTGLQVILVQMTSDVIRMVIGMPVTTLQWESSGGMRIHFKVMAIMVPQVRPDQADNAAVIHGTA